MNRSTSLMSQFERQASLTPNAVAVDDGGQLTTYQQLDAWSDAVCAELLAAGVAPGGLIGVLLPRDSRWIAAILGVLKTGCGYVPLDPMYPATRLELMASDAALTLLLGDAVGTDPATGLPCVAMPPPDATPRSGSRPAVDADSPAYVIYTSGSSGRPKGVPIRHRNVLALMQASAERMQFSAGDVWSLFHSFSFDFSVWEMWGPLLTGARIVLVPAQVRPDPAGYVSFLADAGVTVCNMVPSVFRHLVAGGAGPQDELAIRQVVFGGEAVDPVSVSSWLAALPADRRPAVANMYGITESTVHVTLRQLTAQDYTRTAPGTLIGTPLSHVRMRLVDPQLQPVGLGEVGEILLDGPGLSEGYLGRPDLNRERFPTRIADDGRPEHCFRTGDLASWDEDAGSYVYRGRLDAQVQLHGHRIELGELEASLRACPQVYDAAVVLQQSQENEPSLVAYVVPAPAVDVQGGADDLDRSRVRDIRRTLAGLLPKHMLPQHIKLVSSLPQTESGKKDRGALVTAPGSTDGP